MWWPDGGMSWEVTGGMGMGGVVAGMVGMVRVGVMVCWLGL